MWTSTWGRRRSISCGRMCAWSKACSYCGSSKWMTPIDDPERRSGTYYFLGAFRCHEIFIPPYYLVRPDKLYLSKMIPHWIKIHRCFLQLKLRIIDKAILRSNPKQKQNLKNEKVNLIVINVLKL